MIVKIVFPLCKGLDDTPPPPPTPTLPSQGLDPALVSLWNFPLAVAVIQGPVIVYKTRIFFILIIRCWLSTENYYIWSFAAPVILITTVSTHQRLIPVVSWFRIYSTNIKSKQKNILSRHAFIQPIYLTSYLRGRLSLSREDKGDREGILHTHPIP